jgi:hypothetical protein
MGFVALALAWFTFALVLLWLAGRIESAAWAGLLLLGGYIALGNVLAFLEKHFGLLVRSAVGGFRIPLKILPGGFDFANLPAATCHPAPYAKYVLSGCSGTICFVALASALCRGSIFPQPLVT